MTNKGATIFVWNDKRMLVRYHPDLSVADVDGSDELHWMRLSCHGRPRKGRKDWEDYWQCVEGQLPINLGDVELKPMAMPRKAVLS